MCKTVIRLGASSHTVTHTPDTGEPLTIDMSGATDGDLSALAQTLCGLHGITGPKPRKPSPRHAFSYRGA